MEKLLAIDDWAGNEIYDYQPLLDGGVKISINRLGQGDAWNNTGEADGKGDYLYKKHTEDSLKYGLLNETYWVLDPDIEWQRQLDWVIKNWMPDFDDLPFSADIELNRSSTPVQLIKLAGNFLGNFEAYYHEKPIIYSAAWFWLNNMHVNGVYPDWQLDYYFWLARYPFATYPRISLTWEELTAWYPDDDLWPDPFPSPKEGVAMKPVPNWQWSGDKFILPGIKGPIDLNFVDKAWIDANKRHKNNPNPIPADQPYRAYLPIVTIGTPSTPNTYKVKVTAYALSIRSGCGTAYGVVGYYSQGSVVTVLETKNQWGRSDLGWFSLAYTEKI